MAGEETDYRIGPTSAASALAWVTVARANIDSIVAAGARAPFRMPPEVVARFHEILDAWAATAEAEPFLYEGSEDKDRARVLLTYWLNIISLTAAQREALGVIDWPAESVPFEQAVGRAILSALRDDEQLRRLNRALRELRRR